MYSLDNIKVIPLPIEAFIPAHIRCNLAEITPPDNHLNPPTHEIHINLEPKPLLRPFQTRHSKT